MNVIKLNDKYEHNVKRECLFVNTTLNEQQKMWRSGWVVICNLLDNIREYHLVFYSTDILLLLLNIICNYSLHLTISITDTVIVF